MFAPIGLSLLASVLWSGVVLGVQRGSSSGPVWGCDGGLCATANFTVTYQVAQGYQEGTHYWSVSKFQMYGTLGPNSKMQAAATQTNPIPQFWKVEFLNAAGTVVWSLYPPVDQCYTAVNDTTSLHWYRCRRNSIDLPQNTTKVRVRFLVDDLTANGTGWQKTWTMNLN